MHRVITYIDGFNLYFGLKSKGYERYLWLDVVRLAEGMVGNNQLVVAVRYFSARISGPPEKVARQQTFLDALSTLPMLTLTFGKYERSRTKCPLCNGSYPLSNEKQTDVNIAVALMLDAFHDRFDTAFLVSGDSDISPAVRAIRALYPKKSIVCAFPPNRTSTVLKSSASASFVIGRRKLAKCQLPDKIKTTGGVTLDRPDTWR